MEAGGGEEVGGGAVSPSMASVAEVDSKRMLGVVMQALGSKKMPVFTLTDCGSQGVMVAVTIDVSCAKYHIGEKPYCAVIEGEPNNSKLLAETSAVLRAIKYLNDQHKVQIVDFSIRFVYGIQAASAIGNVKSSLCCLDKVIEQWGIAMGKCKELIVKLHKKDDASDGVEHEYEKWYMYRSLKDFMGGLVEVYNEKITEASAKALKLEFLGNKYHERSTERYQGEGCMQTVVVPQKMILDCVLEYLGSGKATYTNGPTSYGLAKGVANFYLKHVEGRKYSGNIQIKGKARDSEGAEEDAAYKSLIFIEDNCKIRVHDIYHADRVGAEKKHKQLIQLWELILDEFAVIKKNWGKMVKFICKERRRYMNEPTFDISSEAGAKKTEAYRFCAKQLEHLENDLTESFEDCADRFEDMRILGFKLEQMKAEMELD